MPKVTEVTHIQDYILEVEFEDQTRRRIDLKDELDGPVFEPLKNIAFFRQVKINPEFDTICWDNGADIAPETLYSMGSSI